MIDLLDRRKGGITAAFATLIGTGIAIEFIPDNPLPPGAMTWSAGALSAGILLVPTLQLMFSMRAALTAQSFIGFGIVYWLLLDLIQGAYGLEGVSRSAVTDGMIMVGAFAAAMWIGTMGKPWRLPQFVVASGQQVLDPPLLRKLIVACFVLGMLPYLIAVNFDVMLMMSYIGQQRWGAPWQRGQLGGWDSFLDHFQYFGYLLPSLAIVLAARRGWLRPDVWLAIVLSVIVLLLLSQGGGRRIVGVTLGAAILCWLLMRKGLNLVSLLGLAAATIGMLWTMQLMLEVRSVGYEGFVRHGRQYDYLHVDDNIFRLMQVIDIVPAERPYIYFQQIYFVLIRPIPRALWEGKPVDPGFDLPSVVGHDGASLSTSIIGEWYLVFGWVSVIFGGWFHGRLAATINTLHADPRSLVTNPVVYAVGIMVLVAGLRSMQDLVIMSYALVAWYAIGWLLNKRRARIQAQSG